MSEVYFREFDKFEDKLSADKRKVWENAYKSCLISRGEIDKVAVKLCNFNGRQAGPCEKKFYESLVGMILACSNSRYVANDGYTMAEPSIKSSLSYFAGMVAARVVGENKKLMGLDPLLHAKDSSIVLGRVNASCFTPDFVGFNKGHTSAYLLEAKGTSWSKDSAGKIKRDSLEHAKDQLSSIGHICYDNKIYFGPSISRYVITSEFCKPSSGASQDKEWRISKVDPPSKGTAILFSDPNISLAAHYENIVRLFELRERADVTMDVRVGGDVVAVHFGSSVIGLDRGIYEKMGAFYRDFYGSN
ncbi:MAG: hypothetical protein Q4B45_04120 [Coriobacteriia bacterium]|nr:hypothetical protein [Coriobacteriia bacterium]